MRTWRAGKRLIAGLTETQVREALQRLDPLWEELFPAEQARVIQLLVERVDVGLDGVDIRLRTEGLASITAELERGQTRSGGPHDGQAEDQERRPHDHGAGADFDTEARREEGRAGAGRRGARSAQAALSAGRQRDGEGDRAGVSMARDAGGRQARDDRRDRDRRTDQ